MTALFPNYNSTHSGKTANSQLLNGSTSANGFNTLMQVAKGIVALFME